jgi:hypothetical protein
VNNLGEIENVGRNDFVVRTSGAFGALADNRLVRNVGGGTLVFPPAAWSGLQLQRISCQPLATVYDATDYMAAFGDDAVALVAQATQVAQAAIAEARAEALAHFTSAHEAMAAQGQATAQQTRASWESFQEAAASLTALPPAIVEQHFPELHLALQSTQAYGYGLPASTVELWRSHVAGARDALLTLDASLGVSQTVGQIAALDLGEAFPEVLALQGATCSLDPAPWNRVLARYAELDRNLRDLGQAVVSLWPSTIADPLLEDLVAMGARMAQGPCDAELEGLARSMSADRGALQRYLADAQRAMQGVDARALTAGQAEFARGLSALGEQTGTLLRLLLEQERLEQDVEFRADEVQQARIRLVGDSGGRSRPAWHSPDYWDRRARQGDPEELEAEVEALDTAAARYEAAVLAREAGWSELGRQWEAWRGSAGSLTGLVPRLQVRVRGVEELVRALSGPPALRTPGAAVSRASACLSQASRRLSDEFREFQATSQRLLDAVRTALLTPPISPELQVRLEAVQVARGLAQTRAGEVAVAFADLAGRPPVLAGRVAQLVAVLSGDPAASGYLQEVDAQLDAVRRGAEDLTESRQRLQGALSAHAAADSAFRGELAALGEEVLPGSPWEGGLNTLEAAMGGLGQDLDAAGAGAASALACAATLAEGVEGVRTSTPARVEAYLASVAGILGESAGALVPPRVRTASEAALVASSELLEAWDGVLQKAAAVGSAAEEFVTAYAALSLPALRPPGAHGSEVAAVQESAMALWQASHLLLQARGELQQPQTRFGERLATLAEALASSGMNAAGQGAGIAWEAVDLNLISGEYEKAQLLAERWGSAASTFPQRMLAFLGPAVPPALQNQMNSLMATLDQRSAQLEACVSQGTAARAATQAGTHASQALSEATSGLQVLAQEVISDLSGIFPPSPGIFGEVAGIFQNAGTLQTRLQGMAGAAATSFQTVAAEAIEGALAAGSCVQTRSNQIAILSNQAAAIMNPGE